MQSYRQKGSNGLLILNHKTSSKVFIDSVVFIKGNANHITFYFNVGRQMVATHSVNFLENYLGNHAFPRVCCGLLIDLNHVENHDSEEGILTVSHGKIANVSSH